MRFDTNYPLSERTTNNDYPCASCGELVTQLVDTVPVLEGERHQMCLMCGSTDFYIMDVRNHFADKF